MQSAEQCCLEMSDLRHLFKSFQKALYATDPETQKLIASDKLDEYNKKDQTQSQLSQDFEFPNCEESIYVTVLGENYLQFDGKFTKENS